ncbi:MAG: translation initiation factor 2 [Gammaproteobacteria bacterium]|nr:translation initiation factor 2 [Gammaproteobacteria bacterium]
MLQQQYLRALSSFEGIVLSQIEVKNSLGNRLNYSIRTGIIILGAIAFTILVLLYTLTTQINRISDVVYDMNTHFLSVSQKMERIKLNMESMEKQVELIAVIDGDIAIMDQEMKAINSDMNNIQHSVNGIRISLSSVHTRVGNMAVSIDQMNLEMQGMTREMHRMGKPARSMNKMFPFP